MLTEGPDIRYMMTDYAERAFFMVTNVSFLDTDYGFQLYCFGFVASALFVSLTVGSGGGCPEKRVSDRRSDTCL